MPGLPFLSWTSALLLGGAAPDSGAAAPRVLVPWSQSREAAWLEERLAADFAAPGLRVDQVLPTDPGELAEGDVILLGFEESWIRARGAAGALLGLAAEPGRPTFAGGFGRPLAWESWGVGRRPDGETPEGLPQRWSDLGDRDLDGHLHLRLPVAAAPEVRVLAWRAARCQERGEPPERTRLGSLAAGTLHSPLAAWRSVFAQLRPGDLVLAPLREMVRAGRDGELTEPLELLDFADGDPALHLGVAFGAGTAPEWPARVATLLASPVFAEMRDALDLEPEDDIPVAAWPAWMQARAGRRVPVEGAGVEAMVPVVLALYDEGLGEGVGGLDEAWVTLFDSVSLVVCAAALVFVGWLVRRKAF